MTQAGNPPRPPRGRFACRAGCCYTRRMTLPFTLPAWMPWWVPILILVPALLYALMFILMPFSVIGVKGRLDGVEARLDEIQGEIRSLSLRLPEPLRNPTYDDSAYEMAPPVPPRDRQATPVITRPPIPPAPEEPVLRAPPARPGARIRPPDPPERRPSRAEPRLDWPRD